MKELLGAFALAFSLLFGSSVAGYGGYLLISTIQEKNCAKYGEFTKQEVTFIGMSCYISSGMRVL